MTPRAIHESTKTRRRGAAWFLLFAASCLARLAPAQTAACQPIAADQILGKDMAAALSVFATLPPDLLLANMPPPGSRRSFHAPELAALAKRYAIALDGPREACFEWSMRPLDRARAQEAMNQALGIPGAHIEIADLTVTPVPPGPVEFPRERLGAPARPGARDPVLWRGEVIYGGSHRYPVFARVRLSVPCDRLLATENLKSGVPVQARQVRVSTGQCFPSATTGGLTLEQVVGASLRRPVATGAEILSDMLAAPKEVNRGDSVAVQVFSGAAHLEFVGKAESAGSSGDLIAVRNPTSNRIFQARVNGKGQAVVEIPW